MDIGAPRRRDHGCLIDLTHAGDVFGHGSAEQRNVLRHVADVLAEMLPLPGPDILTIEIDAADGWCQGSDDQPRQGRFARR